MQHPGRGPDRGGGHPAHRHRALHHHGRHRHLIQLVRREPAGWLDGSRSPKYPKRRPQQQWSQHITSRI
jgi:hypothetical protein